MNRSPEAQLLTRYALMGLLGILAMVIGPRAFAGGTSPYVLLIAALIGTRIVYAAPGRFMQRQASPVLGVVWYAFLLEVAAAGVAFTLAVDRRGSLAGTLVALAIVFGLDVLATRLERAEYEKFGLTVTPRDSGALDETEGAIADAGGPANQVFKNALADAFSHVPTVLRAYFVTAADARVLAVRYAYPWVDEDAVLIANVAFRRMFPLDVTLDVVALDNASEARVSAVASAFYERAAVPTATVRVP